MSLRLGIFLGGFILFYLWGLKRPYKSYPFRGNRLFSNLALGSLGALAGLFIPGGLYALAWWLEEHSWGLLNHLSFPRFITIIFTIIFLDLIIYAQHVLTHKIPILWRLHKVHHGDPEFDTSTALRFHPLEILFSLFYKAIFVALLGLDKTGVLVFEILLNFSAMFNHGNFQLSGELEKKLRAIIVTPDFHRVHHSPERSQTNSNYGFFFSLWDYLFGTYNSRHFNSTNIGFHNEPKSSSRNLWSLIIAPFSSR